MKFVQVGAHIGQNDFASGVIKQSEVEFGLLVEPLPQLIPHLQESYRGVSNITIESKAITLEDNQQLTFFYDKNDPITELSSLNKQHLVDHNIAEADIEEILVQGEKLETILDRYEIKQLDWLFIDTEGHDCDILLAFDFSNYEIQSIVFEYTHSDGAFSKGGPKLDELLQKLTSLNYEISTLDAGNLLCKLKSKINVIYRGCNLETPQEPLRQGRPQGFDKRVCFDTLHRAIQQSNRVKNVHIVIDGDAGYLSDHIENLGYSITYIDKRSNKESLRYCYDLAASLDGTDHIYFVEDDYWHTADALDVIAEGIDFFGLVTGYDHMDRYTGVDDVTHGKDYIFLSNTRHWRTAESTTCTWACSRETFDAVKSIAKEELLEDRNFFRRLLSEKRRRLHTPIPAVSTHLMEGYTSPFFNFN